MSVNINSYILPEETRKRMISAISKTIISKVEHGFRLCLNEKNNFINPGKLCKGKACYIETAEFECEEDEKPIGIFHTHPHQNLLEEVPAYLYIHMLTMLMKFSKVQFLLELL